MKISDSFDAVGWFALSPSTFRKAQVLLDDDVVPADVRQVMLIEDAFEEADSEIEDFTRVVMLPLGSFALITGAYRRDGGLPQILVPIGTASGRP